MPKPKHLLQVYFLLKNEIGRMVCLYLYSSEYSRLGFRRLTDHASFFVKGKFYFALYTMSHHRDMQYRKEHKHEFDED